MKRLPNKATIGGMLAFHEGNHNETGNPHSQYPLVTPLTLEVLGNKVTINQSNVVKHGNVVTIMCNFTVTSPLVKYDSIFKISGASLYFGDYIFNESLGLQITDNDAGTGIIKMMASTPLQNGTYSFVTTVIHGV